MRPDCTERAAGLTASRTQAVSVEFNARERHSLAMRSALLARLRRDEYKQDFVRLVYGYDLLFFIGETKSATFSVVPQVE